MRGASGLWPLVLLLLVATSSSFESALTNLSTSESIASELDASRSASTTTIALQLPSSGPSSSSPQSSLSSRSPASSSSSSSLLGIDSVGGDGGGDAAASVANSTTQADNDGAEDDASNSPASSPTGTSLPSSFSSGDGDATTDAKVGSQTQGLSDESFSVLSDSYRQPLRADAIASNQNNSNIDISELSISHPTSRALAQLVKATSTESGSELAKLVDLTPSASFNSASQHEAAAAALAKEANAATSGRGISYERMLNDAAGKSKEKDTAELYKEFFQKSAYSKFWSANKKWEDFVNKAMKLYSAQDSDNMLKSTPLSMERLTEVSLSQACTSDIKFMNMYIGRSTNLRWLTHMVDSLGKIEAGILAGNVASLGHVMQCVKLRAPAIVSNISLSDASFDEQTELLGERFRGKYCLASYRPVMPPKLGFVSSHLKPLDSRLLSNISYLGAPSALIKNRQRDMSVPNEAFYKRFDRSRQNVDDVPFESELYQSIIDYAPALYSLPRMIGLCFPSSCTSEDVKSALQASFNDRHLVIDLEFDCEVQEDNTWEWSSMPRVSLKVVMIFMSSFTLGASILRFILVAKIGYKISNHKPDESTSMRSLLEALEVLSLDKTVGWLFVKTKTSTHIVDTGKFSNRRSTTIDAIRGALTLLLVYTEMVHLGGLPVPFMWSRWYDAMIPFHRLLSTQFFLSVPIWSQAFYFISAYLIAIKIFENCRPTIDASSGKSLEGKPLALPSPLHFALRRYIRLVLPMIGFVVFNNLWPRLSNGFVMQDQSRKLMAPCDTHGYTNMFLFHNYNRRNETCLWPSHVSATFFQLHLISYPIIALFLYSIAARYQEVSRKSRTLRRLACALASAIVIILIAVGMFHPAIVASRNNITVPFLIDYLDADNYRLVVELMYLPVTNHLTCYMLGIVVAFLVSRDRVLRELSRQVADQNRLHWSKEDSYTFQDVSLDSTQGSSSTHSIDKLPEPASQRGNQYKSRSIILDDDNYDPTMRHSSSTLKMLNKPFICTSLSALSALAMIVSLTCTWYWNGFYHPMTASQLFWYVALTKAVFSVSFGYIFYRHIASRQNSLNPWLLTRFLVPIGRMSLTVFYMSFLVIWFDLLSSPYPWHPSHYFIFEKYGEIIFVTLIIGMLVYGTLEGPMKAIEYMTFDSRQKSSSTLLPSLASDGDTSRLHKVTFGKFYNLFIDKWIEDSNSWEGDNKENSNNNQTAADNALQPQRKARDDEARDMSKSVVQLNMSSKLFQPYQPHNLNQKIQGTHSTITGGATFKVVD